MRVDLRQVAVNFRGFSLVALFNECSGVTWVAVKLIAEGIGLDWASQYRKLTNNPQFSHCHMTTTGSDGKQYEMLCLPIEELGMWLCSINSRRVKPELQERLLQFQKFCQMAIYDAATGRTDPARMVAMERLIEELVVKMERQEEIIQRQGETIQKQGGTIQTLAGTISEMQRREEIDISYAGRVLNSSRKRGHLHAVSE